MQWRDSSSRIVCAAGGARSIGTLVLILTLCIASTLWAKPPRREHTQRATQVQQETEAEVPNTLYWNSVTKEWNAASFGGTLPVSTDKVYVDGRSQSPIMVSVNRAGLDLGLFDVAEAYEGDVGQPGDELKLAADDLVWRGRGKLYWKANGTTDRVTIDTPNTAHEIVLTYTTGAITQVSILRGRAKLGAIIGWARIFVGSRTNPWSDAYLTMLEQAEIGECHQYGGNVVFDGGMGIGTVQTMSGGYLQLNGTSATYIQTGGHCEFPGTKLTATTPLITKAILLRGSMDATKLAAGQSITTLYIDVDNFELTEDSKLTVGTRIKLGGP